MKNRSSIEHIISESEFEDFTIEYLSSKLGSFEQKDRKICIAISGGKTPLAIWGALIKANVKWENFLFFMVDERCVPALSNESNYGNLLRVFFRHIPSVSFKMYYEDQPIENSVHRYEEIIWREVKSSDRRPVPVFDLVVLGMGEDGHTASLFPNTEALNEKNRLITKNHIPNLGSERITMTYPLLTNAKETLVLIKGGKKVAIFEELRSLPNEQYPISKIVNSETKVTWILGV